MIKAIDIIIIEDSPTDAQMVLEQLDDGGFDVRHVRVETEDELRSALLEGRWAAVLSDYNLPGFDALAALKVMKELELDIPFIIISGTIGEETAVAAMKEGAHDYIMKGNLPRLVPALEREMRDYTTREAKRRVQREQEQTQKELKKTNDFLQTILDSLGGTAIYTCNGSTDYRLTYMSSGIKLITGYDTAQFLDDPHFWVNAIHPDDVGNMHLGSELALNTVVRREYRFRHKEGGWHHIFDICRVVRFAGDSHDSIIGVIVDVTERVHSELERKQALAKLHEANKMASLGRMAGAIAHEVNNPLSIIIGKARQLRELVESPTENQADIIKFAAVIDSTAQRIVKIVNGLKSSSRKTDKDPFQKHNLNKIIEGTLAFCEAKFKFADIRISVEKVPHDLIIECREAEISQVLVNLLSNAFDAIEDLTEKWVAIECHLKSDEWIELTVSDSGPGLPEEVRHRILEPFFTTKAPGKGTGLGLSISREIIQDHGGVLALDEFAANTCFIIRLPVCRGAAVPSVY